jgi:hypothetical protein
LRPITQADAHGVSELVARCYGENYPKRFMYEPEQMASLIRAGAYHGVVAATAEGIVGHIGFTWPTAASTVAEAGTTVVDPSTRGLGLMHRLALVLAELLVSEGAVGFIHFPTTAHEIMQRASLSAGGHETGVMLGYLPPDARDLEIAEPGQGRTAVTVVYQPLLMAPAQSIHLPTGYRELILGLAEGLGLRRTPAPTHAVPAGRSILESTLDSSRQIHRISVQQIRADIGERVSMELEHNTAALVHIDLPMNDASIDDAVEQLRRASFVYAAWLPGWAGHDVLRMQYLAAPWEIELAPTLYSACGEDLMRAIRAELGATS